MMRLIALLVVFACAHGTAMAGDGFYIGAGLGQSSTDTDADADSTFVIGGPIPPDSFGIGGFHFDSEETTWSALLGWEASDWLAIEAGYRDLGNFGALIGFRVAGAPDPALDLGIEEWSLGARFSTPVSRRVMANWFIGVSRVAFEARGSRSFITGGIPIFPGSGPIEVVTVPFATPEDETGLLWGFGFTWQVDDRIGVDLGFRRHDVRVLEIDTLSLQLLWSFQRGRGR